MKKLSLLFTLSLCLPISNVTSCSSKKTTIGGFKKIINLSGFTLDFQENYISDIRTKFDSFRKEQFTNVVYSLIERDYYLTFDLKDVALMSFEINQELIEYKFELHYGAAPNNRFDKDISLSEALAITQESLNQTFLTTFKNNLYKLKGLLETKVAGIYSFDKLSESRYSS